MRAGARVSRRILSILILLVSAAAADVDDPGVWPHYRHTLLGGALGGAMGMGFGMLATSDGDEEAFGGAVVGGLLGGYLLGTAYAANTVTAWHEANGSFVLDLLGAVGGGVATVFVGEGLASAAGSSNGDGIRSVYALAIWGTVPAGAVLAQRVLAGAPEELAAWHPRGTSPGTIGVIGRWAFR